MTADLLNQFGMIAGAMAAAIALVLVARKPMRQAFGARVAYGLWLAVPLAALAALLPTGIVFEPAAAFEAPLFLEQAQAAPSTASPAASAAVPMTVSAGFSVDALALPALAFWALGTLIGLGALAMRQRHFVKANALDKLAGPVHVAASDKVGPAVIGLWRPRIIVPSNFRDTYTARERALIFAHERAHIHTGDMRLNALALLLVCLNWFNPLAYLAYRAFRQDQELACDERVMRRHAGKRKSYAEALLKSQLLSQAAPLSCAWPAGDSHPLKERVARLKAPALPATRRLTGAIALTAALGLSGGAAWATFAQGVVYIHNVEEGSAEAGYVEARHDERDEDKTRHIRVDVDVDPNVDYIADAQGIALVNAIMDGRDRHARALIEGGANVNYVALGDGTPLLIAAREGERDLAILLLEAGANPNVYSPGDGTALIAAAGDGNQRMVELLLDAGADPNAYAPGDGIPLVAAVRDGDEDVVTLLIERGADVNTPAPGDGNALIEAARRGEMRMARQFIAAGADVNGFVPGDETPLINASQQGDMEMVRYLVEQGADVNLVVEAGLDREGNERFRSPLGQAVAWGHEDVADYLRQQGAKPSGYDEDGPGDSNWRRWGKRSKDVIKNLVK